MTVSQKIWRTLLAATAFFFLMASYYAIQPTHSSILLAHIDARYFHLFYLLNGVVTLGGVFLYNHCVSLFSRTHFIRLVFAVIIGLLILFWGIFSFLLPMRNQVFAALDTTDTGWWRMFTWDTFINLVVIIYHLFIRTYILFFTAMFWSFNHEQHHWKEAKWLYPYIFLGG